LWRDSWVMASTLLRWCDRVGPIRAWGPSGAAAKTDNLLEALWPVGRDPMLFGARAAFRAAPFVSRPVAFQCSTFALALLTPRRSGFAVSRSNDYCDLHVIAIMGLGRRQSNTRPPRREGPR
jgi:hypothetical protein